VSVIINNKLLVRVPLCNLKIIPRFFPNVVYRVMSSNNDAIYVYPFVTIHTAQKFLHSNKIIFYYSMQERYKNLLSHSARLSVVGIFQASLISCKDFDVTCIFEFVTISSKTF
jgi:hypothetical protein